MDIVTFSGKQQAVSQQSAGGRRNLPEKGRRNSHANAIYLRGVATARLPAASAPSGEARGEAVVTFPGKWNAKSWTARTLRGNLVVHWATKVSPGSKGFPISLNGALIVIPPDEGEERRNGRFL